MILLKCWAVVVAVVVVAIVVVASSAFFEIKRNSQISLSHLHPQREGDNSSKDF
jgi:hypothetical protein